MTSSFSVSLAEKVNEAELLRHGLVGGSSKAPQDESRVSSCIVWGADRERDWYTALGILCDKQHLRWVPCDCMNVSSHSGRICGVLELSGTGLHTTHMVWSGVGIVIRLMG